MKKFLRWGMVTALVTVLAFTSFNLQPAVSSQEQVMDLTLDQALKLAEQNSTDIKLAAIARNSKSVALDQANDAKRSVGRGTIRSLSDLITRDVTPVIAQKKYDSSQLDYDIAVKAAKFKVISAYYSLQSAKTTLTLKQDSAARSKEALNMVEAKYKVGTAAKLEVDQQKVTVASAEAAVAEAEQAVQTAQLSFNKLLVLPLTQQVNPTTPAKLVDYKVDYDAAKEKAVKEDSSLRSAEITLAEAEATRNAYQSFLPGTYSAKLQDINYQSAKVSYDNAVYSANINVISAYNSLQSAKRQYDILVSQVKIAEDSARLTRMRYQVGMATLYDVNVASNSLDQVKQQYQSAIFSYNLAAKRFEYGIFSSGSSVSGE